MIESLRFEVFVDGERGPIRRGSFLDFESAKVRAQALANVEGKEFFVFSFNHAREVARFFPKPRFETLKVSYSQKRL